MTLGAFPATGTDWATLAAELEELKVDDADWRAGQLASYTYFFREDVLDVQKAAYTAYIAENGLASPKVLRSVPRLLEDIAVMVRDLFGAPVDSGFSFTSGGTESIFCAVKAARDRARAERGERFGHYNVVAPASAHPALDKAGQYLDVEIRRTSCDAELRSDVGAIEAACDSDTVMLYASAPSYVFGVVDRVEDLAALALRTDLWLHVDGCWGGFISPFAHRLGYDIPPWDLSVDGVTSLSADIHKFGYAAKGAGVLLFRDPSLQEFEKFEFSDWPHGTYATPTFTGSKPAGSIAAAWAVLRYLGEAGYLESTREAMDATVAIRSGDRVGPGARPADSGGREQHRGLPLGRRGCRHHGRRRPARGAGLVPRQGPGPARDPPGGQPGPPARGEALRRGPEACGRGRARHPGRLARTHVLGHISSWVSGSPPKSRPSGSVRAEIAATSPSVSSKPKTSRFCR